MPNQLDTEMHCFKPLRMALFYNVKKRNYVPESGFWLGTFTAGGSSFTGWFLDSWSSLGTESWQM